jgi:hypothetical protein
MAKAPESGKGLGFAEAASVVTADGWFPPYGASVLW